MQYILKNSLVFIVILLLILHVFQILNNMLINKRNPEVALFLLLVLRCKLNRLDLNKVHGKKSDSKAA